jgi:homocysteine S-methyltransferase
VKATAPAPSRSVPAVSGETAQTPVAAVDRREKSALARALADGRFAIVMEVSAPRGLDLAGAVSQARRFRDLGAAAVNVPDYPKTGARASALAFAVLLEQAGVETLLHYSCRNRSLLGMQTELVGAHAMGVRNVLLTTGYPAPEAAIADATSGSDVDAVGLTNMVSRLNRGVDIGGQAFGAPSRFHIGVAVNPFAPDLESELNRLKHKVEAGAEFIVTPPIFDVDAFGRVLDRLTDTGLPVVAGLAAIDGLRHAEFLASEVTGVKIVDATFDRLRRAKDERAEALAITLETADWLRSRVAGVQMTSFHGTLDTAERVLGALASRGLQRSR